MPVTGKTPIASFGDDTPIDDSTIGAPPAGFSSGFGATPAPSGLGSFGAVSPGQQGGFGAPAASTGFGGSTSIGVQQNFQAAPQQPQTNLTAGAATAVAGGAESSVENTNTDWINKKWRPVMGWMYMMVCVCDFTLFPILWSVLQAVSHGSVTNQWQPLTLQGAGLFHVAMGAVLGIAAYGRTKEKVAGAA
jgi:hypothetical protein